MKKILAAFLFVLIFGACSFAMDLDVIDSLTGSGERVRLGIMKFTSKTYDVPDSRAAGISDFFARLLFKADDIMLVERERIEDIASELRLGMSGLVDPKTAAQVGKLVGAEYMLLGSITNLGHAHSGGTIPLPWLAVTTNEEKVKAELDVRVVKVETGEVVCTESAAGVASKSTTGIATAWIGVQDSEFSGIEGNAIFNAVAQIAPKIQKALTGRDTLTSLVAAELKKAKKSGKTAKKTQEEKKTTSTKRRKTKQELESEKAEAPEKIEPETPKSAEISQSSDDNNNNSVSSSSEEGGNSKEPEAPKISIASEPEQSANENHSYENNSTDPAKVIQTYDLSSGEKNTLRIRHLNLRQY